jgi:adenylosuccinate synthase
MNRQRLLQRILFASGSLAAAAALAVPAVWAAQNGAAKQTRDQFFIISSVDVPKHQMVLKLPTEVTLTMKVNDKTLIVGEKGQRMDIKQLRSGDTVYITSVSTASGQVATKIRLGPMTVQELHRRYLKGYAVPIPPPLPPKVLTHPEPTKVRQGR